MFAIDTSYQSPARPKNTKSRRLAKQLSRINATHLNVGFAGESLAIQVFQDAGFKAFKTEEKQCGDLTVIDRKTGQYYAVEVKAARKSSVRNSWQFCLKKDKHTDCSFSDFVLFILFDDFDANYYLVPSGFVGTAKSLQFSHPTKYRGKFAPFLVRGIFSFASSEEVASLKVLQ